MALSVVVDVDGELVRCKFEGISLLLSDATAAVVVVGVGVGVDVAIGVVEDVVVGDDGVSNNCIAIIFSMS